MSRNKGDKKRKRINPKLASLSSNEENKIRPQVLDTFGLSRPERNENDQVPYLVLKYLDIDKQCLSHWNQDELKALGQSSQKLRGMTWAMMRAQGGKKGNKTGFGYTKHQGQGMKLSDATYQKLGLSRDIDSFSELRLGGKARVHGFKLDSAFFVVWLDKDHERLK